jgi:pilus assembly protein CpaF
MNGDAPSVDEAVTRVRANAGQAGSAPSRDDVAGVVANAWPLLAADESSRLVATVLAEVAGLGPLEPLLADEAVTDIVVNGPGVVWVERAGRLRPTDVVLPRPDDIVRLVERVVAPLGLRLDRSVPYVDARLPDGSRLHAVVPPVAVDGPCLAIRRFRARAVALDEIVPSPLTRRRLVEAVRARRTIVISGGTGAGKTTLLNALAAAIPADERLVTIEDAAELRLPDDRHVVRLEARPGNADGAGEVTIRQLVRNALRLRPDRIIVGEVRGGEAFDMLQALNTGHAGSLTTCHANSPHDALRRLETMALLAGTGVPAEAIRTQLHAAVDLVVQVARSADGTRGVVDVADLGTLAAA